MNGDNDHKESKLSSSTEIGKNPFPCTLRTSSIVAAATLFIGAIAILVYTAFRWAWLVDLGIFGTSLSTGIGIVGGTAVFGGAVLVGELVKLMIEHQRLLSNREAENAQLKASLEKKAQMRLAVDAIPMAACVVDDNLNLVHANPAALAMFGYTETELVGQHMEILKIPYVAKLYGNITGHNTGKFNVGSALENIGREVKAQHRDGRTLDLDLTLRILPDQKLFVASFLDLTADMRLREMTQKYNVQKDMAERYEAACAYLSHEIRNQLYPQSVVLQEMKAGNFKQTSNIDMILDANTTVTTILNQVLDFAKWQSGEFKIESVLFPITRLFAAIVSYATAKNATVEGLAQVPSTLYVRADEHLLKQAATNLISNASKFSDGQPVSIFVAFEKLTSEKGVIVVRVTDKGRGMTAKQLTKAMVPFGQIRKTGEARSGTGLGLPLTKAMIEGGHKGTLTLTSEGLGKGTIATMRVPVQCIHRYETPRPKSDALWWVKPHPGATADVLVVDDVKLNRMVTIMSARKLGLSFHEAADGLEAVERLRTNTYSMVFMDRDMPQMNGDLATEQARANGYTLPIIMTSGNTFKPSDKAELTRRGVTAFLNKMSVPGTRHAMQKLQEIKQKSV